ncbi:hypothetical protein EU245_01960 [Lentibacillus lipolyticus]|nr:hypothetical protein EU245_01960 [Lentibacillus lipolyticus]
MKLPQIRITSQPAKIQIQRTSPIQELRQPKAKQSIRQPQADVSIRTKPSKLTIDQSQAWAAMNQMSVSKLTETFAKEGHKRGMEGIARRTRQGAELMKIENGGNPIARQAARNAFDGMKRIGITFIPPANSVKLHYEPAKVKVNVKKNDPVIHADPQKVIHRYTPGDVSVHMRQHEDLQIDFVQV